MSAKEALKALEDELRECTNEESKKQTLRKIVSKFPFLYGYWIKLLNICGNDPLLWQEALSACHSIELWTQFLNTDAGSSVESAKSAVENIGNHFYSHPIHDIYLSRTKSDIPFQLVRTPLFEFAKYYKQSKESSNSELLAEIKQKVALRWKYEQQIRRHYFHVIDLPSTEVTAWEEYLEFIEQHGDFLEACGVYDRCTLVAALYPQFWLRYLKFLFKNNAVKSKAVKVIQNSTIHNPQNSELVFFCAMYAEHLEELDLARKLLETNLPELVKFDLRHNTQPSSLSADYLVALAMETGDIGDLKLGQVSKKQAATLFSSPKIDPIRLMPLYEKGLCTDKLNYCAKLKHYGYLKEFIDIDSHLGVSKLPRFTSYPELPNQAEEPSR